MLFKEISKEKSLKFIFVMRKLHFFFCPENSFPTYFGENGIKAKSRAMKYREKEEISRD